MNLFSQIFVFIVETLFSSYLLVLLLRVILQGVRVNPFNPLFQGLIALTEPVIQPLQRFIPRYGYWEISGIVMAVLLNMVRYALLKFFGTFPLFGWLEISVLGIFTVGSLLIDIFFYAILIEVLLSWLNPMLNNPLTECLTKTVAPILNPIRNYVPALAGFDLSPLIALMGLKILAMIINKMPLIFLS